MDDNTEKNSVQHQPTIPELQTSREGLSTWQKHIDTLKTNYPNIIGNILYPDTLNGNLTLEQIDTHWDQLRSQHDVDPDLIAMFGILRDFLILPRIVDSFPSSPDGHNQRRAFRRDLMAQDQNLAHAFAHNDLRMGKIAGALAAIEYYGLVTGDDQFLKKHTEIYDMLITHNDDNNREIYSTLENEIKFNITDKLRSVAREVYYKDVEGLKAI